MAIFHFNVRSISKSESSVSAAYEYAARLGKYAKRGEALHVESGNLPRWANGNTSAFWAAADKHERANARLAVRVEFALPIEGRGETNINLAREFAEKFTAEGKLTWSMAIHDDEKNPHAHLIVSERQQSEERPDHTAGNYFKRAGNSGGVSKTRRIKLENKGVEKARELWETVHNSKIEQKIDRRSHEARNIETIPTVHEGWGIGVKENKERNEAIREKNSFLRRGKLYLAKILTTISHATEYQRRRANRQRANEQDHQRTQSAVSGILGKLGSGLQTINRREHEAAWRKRIEAEKARRRAEEERILLEKQRRIAEEQARQIRKNKRLDQDWGHRGPSL